MDAEGKKPKHSALDTVQDVLRRAGLDPKPMQDAPGVTVDFKHDDPKVIGRAIVIDEDSVFLFYLEFLERAKTSRHMQVAEFLTRANYGLNTGNFEMDFSNGGVRYKSSLDFSGTELSGILVRNAVLAAMNAVELYDLALRQVMNGQKSPEEAMEEAEASMEEE